MRPYAQTRGTLTADEATVILDTSEHGTIGIDVRGTFVADITPEATVNNSNWFTLSINPVGGGAAVTTITAAGAWTANCGGFAAVRLRADTYTSGTATVTLQTAPDSGLSTNVSVSADTEFPTAAALADGASAAPTTTTAGVIPLLMNATTVDRQRAVVNALDSTGTGIAAAGLVGQLDDASTGTVTENQFAPVRISTRRALLVEGVASGTAQPISAASGAIASGAIASGAIASGAIAAGAIATGATSIAAAEDDASANLDTGVKILFKRLATPANASDTDGDYEQPQMSAGRIWTSATIDAALPAGTNAIGKLAANSGVDIGDVDVLSIAAGDNNIGNVDIQLAGTAITGGAGAVASGTPRVTLASDDPAVTAIQIIDDWDESDRAKVNPIVGQAGIAAGAGAVGATVPRVTLASDDPAVAALQIMDDWDNAASDGASISGDVAHDSPDAGEPVKIGGIARQANPTAVADLDRVNGFFDDVGRPVIAPYQCRDLVVQSGVITLTNTTETTLISAGASGVFHDLLSIRLANTSATAVRCDLRDATAGTVIDTFYLPAGDTRGQSFTIPFKQTTAANNWTVQLSASVTDVRITAIAVKNV